MIWLTFLSDASRRVVSVRAAGAGRGRAVLILVREAELLEHLHILLDGVDDSLHPFFQKSMLPVMEAEAPVSNAVAPFCGRSLRPAARRMFAVGLM